MYYTYITLWRQIWKLMFYSGWGIHAIHVWIIRTSFTWMSTIICTWTTNWTGGIECITQKSVCNGLTFYLYRNQCCYQRIAWLKRLRGNCYFPIIKWEKLSITSIADISPSFSIVVCSCVENCAPDILSISSTIKKTIYFLSQLIHTKEFSEEALNWIEYALNTAKKNVR